LTAVLNALEKRLCVKIIIKRLEACEELQNHNHQLIDFFIHYFNQTLTEKIR